MYTITSTAGDAFRARFVVMNFGTFTQAKLPRAQGIENFEGEMFHTSRWNYEYTGGSSEGNLDKLGDKSVAIIGTVRSPKDSVHWFVTGLLLGYLMMI